MSRSTRRRKSVNLPEVASYFKLYKINVSSSPAEQSPGACIYKTVTISRLPVLFCGLFNSL